MVHPAMPQRWMAAYDEAIGWDGEPRNIERFLVWLRDVGIDGASQAVSAHASAVEGVATPGGAGIWSICVTPQFRRRARYRLSGQWFGAVSTRVPISDGAHKRSWGLLEQPATPIPRRKEQRNVMEQMIFQSRRLKPETILDLCSGGGFHIARMLSQLVSFKLAVSTDRALDEAIWIQQYVFRYLGFGARADSVGTDVRMLPLRNSSFDLATCFHGLFEMQDTSRMLREANRVICPGGHLVIGGYREWPYQDSASILPNGLTRLDLRRFSDAADIHHVEFDQFLSRVDAAGFDVVSVDTIGEEQFVAVLRPRGTETF